MSKVNGLTNSLAYHKNDTNFGANVLLFVIGWARFILVHGFGCFAYLQMVASEVMTNSSKKVTLIN